MPDQRQTDTQISGVNVDGDSKSDDLPQNTQHNSTASDRSRSPAYIKSKDHEKPPSDTAMISDVTGFEPQKSNMEVLEHSTVGYANHDILASSYIEEGGQGGGQFDLLAPRTGIRRIMSGDAIRQPEKGSNENLPTTPSPSHAAGYPEINIGKIFSRLFNSVSKQKQTQRPSWRLVRELQQRLTHHKAERTKLKAKVQDLEIERVQFEHRLEEERNAHQKALEDNEKAAVSVRMAQEKAFTLLDDAEWQPEEDDKIRRDLNALEKECRDWCKTYAYSTLGDSFFEVVFQEQHAGLLFDLGKFCRITNEGLVQSLQSPAMKSRASSMLLAAWLTQFIYTEILSQPLYFLGMRDEEIRDEIIPEISKSWERLLAELHRSNKKDASVWRAQLLRQLQPRKSTINSTLNQSLRQNMVKTQELTWNAIDSTVFQLVERFSSESAPLIANYGREAHNALCKIFYKATDLATTLWTQKRYYEVKFLYTLPTAKFGTHEGIIQAHALHNQLLEDDPQALDEKPILMITHPALIAYGDSAGTDYSVSRVLKKATVWMGC